MQLYLHQLWNLNGRNLVDLARREVAHADRTDLALPLEVHELPPRLKTNGRMPSVIQRIGGVGERPMEQIDIHVLGAEPGERPRERGARLVRT